MNHQKIKPLQDWMKGIENMMAQTVSTTEQFQPQIGSTTDRLNNRSFQEQIVAWTSFLGGEVDALRFSETKLMLFAFAVGFEFSTDK